MSDQKLINLAERLEQKIEGASSAERLSLQPEFTRTLDQMREAGIKIPLRLKRLDDALCDEAVESSFDNMPV